MKHFVTLLCYLAILLLAPVARAWTYLTPESIALSNLQVPFEIFESKYQRPPRDWAELELVTSAPLDRMFPLVKPTIRYAYFDPPLTLRFHTGRTMEVVAITRSPMQETTLKETWAGRLTYLKGPGRYLLYRDSGRYLRQWIEEPFFQHIWPSTGVVLPEPDHEGNRPWVAKARASILTRRVIGGVISMAVIFRFILALSKRMRSKRTL